MTEQKIKIHALVDLMLREDAGGHVKCWQRLAEAATDPAFSPLDLTVHFMGTEARVEALSDRVRYQCHTPVFSTARLPFLGAMPDHTDLAPKSRSLARALAGADLIHATGAEFTFAKTGLAVARKRRVPLTLSLHTDTARYARIFTGRTIEGLFGKASFMTRLLNDRCGIPAGQERAMIDKLQTMAAAARHVLMPTPTWPGLEMITTPTSIMRRGIDRSRFGQTARDRAWLESVYDIPEDRVVVAYAGRVNRGKNIGTLINAAAQAIAAGADIHVILMGEGEDRETAAASLGNRVSCPGVVAQTTVSRVLAASDVLAFPSMVEVFSNTVVEGIASGLPVIVTPETGMRDRLTLGEAAIECGGVDMTAWADALITLATDSADRARRSALARVAANSLPSWTDVLVDDVLPIWQRYATDGLA